MKNGTLLMIGFITLGLIFFSQCKSSKVLLYQEEGKFVVDNNFLIQKTKAISGDDIEKLIALDKDFTDRTKGALLLHYLVQKKQLVKLNQLQRLDRLSRLTTFNQIHQGCLEAGQIDWAQFTDLKNRFDGIISKYNALEINGNFSIQNNNIATKALKISDQDISFLNSITFQGAIEVDVCGDYMGQRAFSRWLNRSVKVPFNNDLNIKYTKILSKYGR